MYPQDQGSGMLITIFIVAGLALLALGRWIYLNYRDDRPRDQDGFRDFGLGPRGLLAYAGIVLMIFGSASCLLGLFLPAILR